MPCRSFSELARLERGRTATGGIPRSCQSQLANRRSAYYSRRTRPHHPQTHAHRHTHTGTHTHQATRELVTGDGWQLHCASVPGGTCGLQVYRSGTLLDWFRRASLFQVARRERSTSTPSSPLSRPIFGELRVPILACRMNQSCESRAERGGEGEEGKCALEGRRTARCLRNLRNGVFLRSE